MRLLAWFFHLMRGTAYILRKGSTLGRLPMLCCFLRIQCKGELLQLFGRNLRDEKLWKQNLHFSDYPSFLMLFGQVFLNDEYFFKSETDRPFVIDCGANVGMSIAYILSSYPQARILAFEADPDNFAILQINRERNNWQNVEILNLALQEREATVHFYARGAGSMVGSVRSQPAAGAVTVRDVQGVRLSSFIDKTVDFIKMDIEGSEEAVLEDLVESGKIGNVKEMVIEYHHHFTPGENRLGGFLSILERAGFGYHLKAPWNTPFSRIEQEQPMMIGAYREPMG
jgi:FkbM family methyltransferase